MHATAHTFRAQRPSTSHRLPRPGRISKHSYLSMTIIEAQLTMDYVMSLVISIVSGVFKECQNSRPHRKCDARICFVATGGDIGLRASKLSACISEVARRRRRFAPSESLLPPSGPYASSTSTSSRQQKEPLTEAASEHRMIVY